MADNEKLSQLDPIPLPVVSGDIIYIIRPDGEGGYDSYGVDIDDVPPGGSGLNTKVTMPTATSDSGAAGEYAVDANQLAIYVAATGWMFFQGFQK